MSNYDKMHDQKHIFTKHAFDRTHDRNMSEELCRRIIKEGVCHIRRSETSGKLRRVYTTQLYKVVVDIKDETVITVMDRPQKFIKNNVFGSYRKKRDRLGLKSK